MEIGGLWTFLQPYIMKIVAVVIVVVVTCGLDKLLSKILAAIFRAAEVGYTARAVGVTRVVLYIIAAVVIANIIAPEVMVFSFLVLLIGLATIFMFIDLLRNIGAEMYLRARDIVRRGDWIEVDGVSVRVVDFDAIGLIGETARHEKVFIPYTKLLSSTIINRVTPFGVLVRVYVDIPQSYGIDGARDMLLKSLDVVKEDLASEPNITYLGSREDKLSFVIEFHIINYRKLTKILTAIDREIKSRVPEAIVKA